MTFDFVAKHRVPWPVGLICEALGISRSGFYAWLSRARSLRRQTDEAMGVLVRQSFISSLKTERTAREVYRTREQARADVFDYIERFYNAIRRHSTLGYVSPVQFEDVLKA